MELNEKGGNRKRSEAHTVYVDSTNTCTYETYNIIFMAKHKDISRTYKKGWEGE